MNILNYYFVCTVEEITSCIKFESILINLKETKSSINNKNERNKIVIIIKANE